MTLRHIRIFLAVCENNCNITQAARALYIAQPAVSQAVAELERYYGVRLFERLNRRLYITEAGRRFQAYAVHINGLFGQMEAAMHNWDGQGILRVGTSVTIGTCFLPAYLKAFRQAYPSVQFQVRIAQSTQLEEFLEENRLDIALIEGVIHSPLLVGQAYQEDELACVCAPFGPFAQGQKVSPEAFSAQPFLVRETGSGTREVLDSVMSAAGYPFQPVWESISTEALVNAVEAGAGVAVLPRQLVARALAEGRVNEFTVDGLHFTRRFHVVWHRDKFLTPAMEAFVALCRDGKAELETVPAPAREDEKKVDFARRL